MLETVGWYSHPFEAYIARGLLESEGIPAFLHSIHHSSLDWPITLALGGIRLQVPSEVVDEAAELLEAEFGFDDGEETIACPACGSLRFTKSEFSWRIAFLVVHFLQIPLPFKRYQYRCLDCGNRWS